MKRIALLLALSLFILTLVGCTGEEAAENIGKARDVIDTAAGITSNIPVLAPVTGILLALGSVLGAAQFAFKPRKPKKEKEVIAVAESKKWTGSITMWVNLIAVIGGILQWYYGKEVLDARSQATILAVLNIILRLKTSSGIDSPLK